MANFFTYFFGAGSETEFSLFTPAHIAPILLMLAVIFLIRRNSDSLRGWKHEEKIRYALAFALIICDMSYYWRLVAMPSLEHGVMENLPLGVCQWSVIFCSFLVLGKSRV